MKTGAAVCAAMAAMAAVLSSCATIDMEQRAGPEVKTSGEAAEAAGGKNDGVIVAYLDPGPPEVVYVEKPVYGPHGTPYLPPPEGKAAVAASNAAGILEPRDYSAAAMIYDYDGDFVYEVYTQPLRATDICLEPGEQVTETPFVSDSERWILGAGLSRENGLEVQHIYVKPKVFGIDASLIINTDRRVYHLIVKSFRDIHMPVVRWRYRSPLPDTYAYAGLPEQGGQAITGPDPRFLSFDYRVRYTWNWFKKPRWLPNLVYDDGTKTYIAFPLDISRSELPAVFENRGDIVNYRAAGNVIIIDKLIEKITVKLDGSEIVIEKKKG
jgi:type IV secretion system protein VirB9